MANASEYSMLFKLSAQLGREFNTTFSSAKRTLTDTQKEINALNRTQADISAYQKQQQAVEGTARKLADLQKEYDNIQREIQETEGFSSSLENKLIEKQRAIDKTSASLDNQTEKLNQMKGAMADAGIDTENLTEESARLTKQIDELADKQAKATKEAQSFGAENVSAVEAIGSAVIALGVQKGLSELFQLYSDTIRESHENADALNTEATQYGIATDKLQGYYYAAELADVSVDTLTSSMAKNTRAMYQAAEGSSQYITAYEKIGVSVKDAEGNLRDSEEVYWEVIDALKDMENETERDGVAMTLLGRNAMSLNTLIKAGSEAMNGYAAEAKKAGYIMSTDMLNTLQQLNDAEQREKNNMTALKNEIGSVFAPELTKLKEIWAEYLADMTAFVHEHPEVAKGFIAITGALAGLLGVYTSYVFIKKTLNTIRALSISLQAKETTATVVDTSAKGAQTVATNSATVAQTGLNAAMMANPVGLVVGAVAALTVGFVALVSIMRNVESEEEKLTLKTRQQKKELDELNVEYKETVELYGETSYEAQSLKWRIDEVTEAYENGKQTVEEYDEAMRSYLDTRSRETEEYKKAFSEIETTYDKASALVSKLEELSASSGTLAKNQSAVVAIVSALNNQYDGLGLTFDVTTGKFNKSTAELKEYAQQTHDIAEAGTKFQEYSAALASRNADEQAYRDALSQYEPYRQRVIEAQEAYDDYLDSMEFITNKDSNGGDLTSNTYYRNLVTAQETAKTFKEDFEAAQAQYKSTLKTIEEFEAEYGTDKTEKAVESTENLQKAVAAVVDEFMTAEEASKYYGVSLEFLNNQADLVIKTQESLKNATDYVKAGFFTVGEAAEYFDISEKAIEAQIKIEDITERIDLLSKSYENARDAAEKSIEGQFELWDTAAIVIPKDIGEINTSLETQLSYWSDYNTDIAKLLTRTGDIDGLSEVIASFADGSTESVNAIAGMASASDEDLRKMVANWQEVKKQQEEASASIAELSTGFTEELGNMKDELEQAVDDLNLNKEAAKSAKDTVDAYVQAIKDGTDDAVKAANKLRTLVAAELNNIDTKEVVTLQSAANSRDRVPNSGKGGPQFLDYYANGTGSAKAGLAIVGEKGPELVMFQGGEQVLTAKETSALLGGGGQKVIITISPSFMVEGGDGDIENKLRAYSDELKNEIFDALDEAGIDAKRGAYV